MSKIRFFVCCILILTIALGVKYGTDPVLANGGGRFLVPLMPSSAGAITLNTSDADWPAGSLFCSPGPACDLTPISGGPTGTVRLLLKDSDDPMIDDELYVFIRVNDATSDLVDPKDNVVLFFDLSHDHAVASVASFDASDDRGIQFRRDNTVGRVFGNLNAPSDDPSPPASLDGRKVVTNDAAFWTVEARLIPSDLGLNHFNSLMGAAAIATDTGANKKSKWPSAVVLTDPLTYANLITRIPIDYTLVIDQSGSMAGVKWDSVRRAGDNFGVVLAKLKDPTLETEFGPTGLNYPGGGDRIGLASFTWNVGSGDTTIKSGLGNIPDPPTPGGYATTNLPMTPGGWTPIAWGINRAVHMFTGVVPDAVNPSTSSGPTITALNATARTRAVMLLSDGQHNRPNPTINFNAAGGDFSYVPSSCGSNSLVRVNPVAIGDDGTTDPMTLDDIMNCFQGRAFTQPGSMTLNYYNTSGTTLFTEGQLTAQLTRFFIETVAPYYHWNIISETNGPPPAFELKAGERKVIVFAMWDNKADANSVAITKPDTTSVSDPGDTNLGLATIALDNPAAGNYTFSNPGGGSNPTRTIVLIDLRTEALFAIDNQPHGTGSTITLKGKLRDDGLPVTGADVRVDIARPDEGFGTYLSTHLPSNCSVVQTPQLPASRSSLGLSRKFDQISITAGQRLGVVVAPGAQIFQIGPGPDAPAAHFNLIQQLFQACGKTGLNRVNDPGLKLFDDGTHGDETASDGIYTLAFENTTMEGSYVFRFRANGTTREGTPFSRVREMGQYVRVDVDPPSSTIDFRDLQQTGTVVIREYHVTPRDRFGNYLGPGRGHLVIFNTTAGTFITPLIDYNNGIYSQVLRFDRSTENPVVTGTVQGKPLGSLGGGGKGFEFFPYIGGSFYENSLGLKNGFTTGARFGYRFPNQLALEFESGITFSKFKTGPFTGQRAYLVQVLGNVRYDIDQWGTVNWTPYVIAGAGGVFLNGGAGNDSAFAAHTGFGSTWRLTNHVGLRADGRVFRFGALNGAGSTTSFQFNGGVVFKF